VTDQTNPWADRHPSVTHFEPLFSVGHLPAPLQRVSVLYRDLAGDVLTVLDDGLELSAGLRKLLEAKDVCVRQAALSLMDGDDAEPAGSQTTT
jgi:hypothetical protein